MSITEKELANTLYERHTSDREPLDWTAVARHAAELLGAELAPEKPEPGTYFDKEHSLVAITSIGDGFYIKADNHGSGYLRTDDVRKLFPSLTPARVVPAEPVELTFQQADEIWQDASGKVVAPMAVRMAMNTAIAKHGHGRVEVEREWLRAGIAELRGNGYGLNGEVIDIITDAVMELLEGGNRG